jgi:hypothetical protein
MATLLGVVPAVRLISAIRSALGCAGGRRNALEPVAPAVVQHSHSPDAPNRMTSHDTVRRQYIIRAPANISRSHGTGGAAAASIGFHD